MILSGLNLSFLAPVAFAVDEQTLNNVNLKADEAPYKVSLDRESISTMNGNLTIREADLSLPGRNGLSFTLSRTYDAGSAQFYKLEYPASNTPTTEDSLFRLGKGWSWDVSYIQKDGSKLYLHLAGRGTYEIRDTATIVGYPWKDISFAADTSVTVNGETSAYAVKSIQKID